MTLGGLTGQMQQTTKEGSVNRILLLSTMIALAACGKTSTALERNRGGSGTGSLLIDARIEQSSSSGPKTTFAVDLQDGGGLAVSGATVVVHNSQLGNVALTEQAGTPGSYE